ncbi:MAG: hypothetical protein K2J47_09740 [Ruminococcus sp.]|nr:hypothetical protein [Ruminococcus sp.]
MKKTLSIILTSMLTVSALPLTASAVDSPNIQVTYDDAINSHVFCDTDGDDVYETEIKKGDVNCDGIIDASDASLILGLYSKLSTSSTYTLEESISILADCNNDGFIDASDVSDVLKIYSINSVTQTENNVSVTKEILSEGITVDGIEIQSGATAVTVNVTNNQGFSLFDFVLDVGSGYDIITDSDGRPVFSKCPTVNYNSHIESSVNDNTVVINGLFGYDCLTEGGIITFYANENSADNNISVESSRLYSSRKWREYDSGSAYHRAGCPLILNGEVIERNPIKNNSVYTVGDINGDMKIDLTDAFDAFYTAYIATNSGFSQIQDVYDLYFPNITDIRAAFLWNEYNDSDSVMNNMGRYSTNTAEEILKYCADTSAGKEYTSGSHITEIRHVG